MKKVFNNFASTPTKKYIFSALLLALLIAAFVLGKSIYGKWNEERLIQKYLNDPIKKQFAEMLRTDQKDLANNNLERARQIGITMDFGLQWYNLGHYDLAAKWWKKGLKIEPNNNIGWYNLGNAYRELKKYSKAENAYRKSMEYAQNGEVDGCLALGEMYKYNYTKKKDEEPKVYLECLKKHKDHRDLFARMAIYYRDAGNKQMAAQYFDKLMSVDPSADVGEELRKLGY